MIAHFLKLNASWLFQQWYEQALMLNQSRNAIKQLSKSLTGLRNRFNTIVCTTWMAAKVQLNYSGILIHNLFNCSKIKT